MRKVLFICGLLLFSGCTSKINSLEPLEYTPSGLFYDDARIVNVTSKNIDNNRMELSAFLENDSILIFRIKPLDETHTCESFIGSMDSNGSIIFGREIEQNNCYNIANMLRSFLPS